MIQSAFSKYQVLAKQPSTIIISITRTTTCRIRIRQSSVSVYCCVLLCCVLLCCDQSGVTDAFHVRPEEWLPDVILLDVMMPGISGFKVAQVLRKKYPHQVFQNKHTTTTAPQDHKTNQLTT